MESLMFGYLDNCLNIIGLSILCQEENFTDKTFFLYWNLVIYCQSKTKIFLFRSASRWGGKNQFCF